jgi:hypothetical protein
MPHNFAAHMLFPAIRGLEPPSHLQNGYGDALALSTVHCRVHRGKLGRQMCTCQCFGLGNNSCTYDHKCH